MKLQMSSSITQSATITSYLLLLIADNTLFIYSISSTPELLYQTNELQHHSVKVYSLGSSFFVIDAQTSQLLQIDTDHSLELQTVAHLNFSCCSLLSTMIADRMKLFILADDHSVLAIWNVQEKTILLNRIVRTSAKLEMFVSHRLIPFTNILSLTSSSSFFVFQF